MNYTKTQLARVAPVQSRGALWRGTCRAPLAGLPAPGRRARRSAGRRRPHGAVLRSAPLFAIAREADGPPRAARVARPLGGGHRRAREPVLMRILGISAHYHDSAAALLIDGLPVAAVQEERLSRRKNDAAFPLARSSGAWSRPGSSPSDLDAVVFYEKPMLKFERILTTRAARVSALVARASRTR